MRRSAVIAAVVVVALAAGTVAAWRLWFDSSARPLVYLSIGDGTQYGCCGDRATSSPELFRQYLADRLGHDVAWVTTASGYQTSDNFIEGQPGSGIDSQFDGAVHLVEQYRHDHRKVVAITLSIGGNDLVEVGRHCSGADECRTVYFAALDRLRTNLDRIYARISAAKDPRTPLLILLYYNASDCGQPGVESSPAELGVLGWNAAIREIATRFGAALVDAYTPFRGNACTYVTGLDSNSAGHAAIAVAYEGAYETVAN